MSKQSKSNNQKEIKNKVTTKEKNTNNCSPTYISLVSAQCHVEVKIFCRAKGYLFNQHYGHKNRNYITNKRIPKIKNRYKKKTKPKKAKQ
jgi:hypothetical protein